MRSVRGDGVAWELLDHTWEVCVDSPAARVIWAPVKVRPTGCSGPDRSRDPDGAGAGGPRSLGKTRCPFRPDRR